MAGRTFAVSDLHGMYNLYLQICDFLEPEDTVYFLGDAADRGPDGWRLIKEIYNNPQWIYIKGNHEDMLVQAAEIMLRYDIPYCEEFSIWRSNGGGVTSYDFFNDSRQMYWVKAIKALPTYAEYINTDGYTIYLSHAGFTMATDFNGDVVLPCDDDLIWDRSHLGDDYLDENCTRCFSVFGHTPIQTQFEYANEPGALFIAGNKICIDNGAFFSGQCCLLDLDTFDEHIFEIPMERKDI